MISSPGDMADEHIHVGLDEGQRLLHHGLHLVAGHPHPMQARQLSETIYYCFDECFGSFNFRRKCQLRPGLVWRASMRPTNFRSCAVSWAGDTPVLLETKPADLENNTTFGIGWVETFGNLWIPLHTF